VWCLFGDGVLMTVVALKLPVSVSSVCLDVSKQHPYWYFRKASRRCNNIKPLEQSTTPRPVLLDSPSAL
jgi:hypothetical protein